jgi:UDP-N-acetylglucosamine 2-epimerase (non-hydrolysing)
MVDTLLASVERTADRPVLERLGLADRSYGLVTLHRPENVDDPDTLRGLFAILDEVASRLPLVLPAHPRIRSQLHGVELNGALHVIEPLGYLDFVALEARARLVLTDSGGVQEETTILGVPCLTLRETTERPITVSAGTNVVVGRDPGRILDAVHRAMSGDIPLRRPELWDGRAGERIGEVLVADAGRPEKLRPSDLGDSNDIRLREDRDQ